MTVSTPTALVAAAPTLFRQGLLALLREQWPQLQLTLTTDTDQVVELAAHRPFGLMVLDGTLPGLDLASLLAQLHYLRPSQRLLVLSDSSALAHRLPMRPGMSSCLLVPSHVLPQALAAALAPWLDAPTETASPVGRPGRARAAAGYFSPRELEVLRLVVADYCNEEIANHLFINVRTVETHRRNLLHKAGTRTLVGLAARAVREGWVA